jgi:sugar O-acyltransferase (sialic acid O-acetyltransferase NeuD family)
MLPPTPPAKTRKVVIFGTQKMAEMAYYYFKNDSDIEPVAFTVDRNYIDSPTFMGLPVVAFEEVVEKYPPSKFDMFVAVGYTKLNEIRRVKYFEAKEKGYKLASYASSRIAAIAGFEMGENCCILENQVVQPDVRFGNNVVVWSGNHFGHNVRIGDHSWVASHVVLSGHVNVGESCFLGINASIRDGIKIADKTLVGAGAIILRNTKPGDVYIGKQTEKYPLNSEQFFRMTDISKSSSNDS